MNLPAGLEDSLIYCFKPEWNNTHGIPRTTLADFEDELKSEDNVNSSATKPVSDSPCGVFNWILGNTYFNQGIRYFSNGYDL